MKFKVSYFLIILILLPLYAYAQDVADTGSAVPEAGPEAAADSEVEPDNGPAATEQPNEADLLLNLDEEEDGQTAVPTASGAGGIARAIVVFIIILAAIFGLFMILKKVSGNKFQSNNLIHIVSSQALAGNKSLHLVELGGELYLIGAADNSVNLIKHIEDKETRDKLRLDMSSDKPIQKNSFKDILGSIFSRGSADKSQGSADFIRQQGDRLKKL